MHRISLDIYVLERIDAVCPEELTRRIEAQVPDTASSLCKQLHDTDVVREISIRIVLFVRLLRLGNLHWIVQVVEEVLDTVVSRPVIRRGTDNVILPLAE